MLPKSLLCSQRNILVTKRSNRGRGQKTKSRLLGLGACDFKTPFKTLVLFLNKCRKAVHCALPLKIKVITLWSLDSTLDMLDQ